MRVNQTHEDGGDNVLIQHVANFFYLCTTQRRLIEDKQVTLHENHTFTVGGAFKAMDLMGHGYIQYEDLPILK